MDQSQRLWLSIKNTKWPWMGNSKIPKAWDGHRESKLYNEGLSPGDKYKITNAELAIVMTNTNVDDKGLAK